MKVIECHWIVYDDIPFFSNSNLCQQLIGSTVYSVEGYIIAQNYLGIIKYNLNRS